MRWLGAAAVVVAAHAGFATLATLNWDDEPDDFGGGPIVIEMVPSAAAMPVDTPDVARGPLLQEQNETPSSKAAEKVVDQQMPPIDPSPLAPEPQVALPRPHPEAEKEPEEKAPQEEALRKRDANDDTPVPLTTAPPRIEAKPAPPASAAPAPADVAGSKAAWQKELIARLDRFKRYPEQARARGKQGDVRVLLTIDGDGWVTESRVVGSSGSPALDEEALAVLQRASPLPPPPGQLAGTSFTWTMHFRIR
ncbi:MAG TPA: energy transducer TonB [Hyphomicrobiaceae bacterium]|nr:energy transducer TonB [Hyphomicrobiaceae bacterium]